MVFIDGEGFVGWKGSGLFCAKAFGGIGFGGACRLPADGDHGDQDCEEPCGKEDAQIKGYMIGKVPEPAACCIPGQRNADRDGEEHGFDQVF